MMNVTESASRRTAKARAGGAGGTLPQGGPCGRLCNGSVGSLGIAGSRSPGTLLWDVCVAPVYPVGFVVVMVFGVTLATPSHAYLDPGTGSMILQVLLGGVAGALVVGKLYWAKIKRMFKSPAPSASKSSENSQSTDTPD